MLQLGITFASHHIILTNALIMVQIVLGVCLLASKRVREALLASVAWSLHVWIGGEGMGIPLTGGAGGTTVMQAQPHSSTR